MRWRTRTVLDVVGLNLVVLGWCYVVNFAARLWFNSPAWLYLLAVVIGCFGGGYLFGELWAAHRIRQMRRHFDACERQIRKQMDEAKAELRRLDELER